MSGLCGGFSDYKPLDAEAQAVFDSIKADYLTSKNVADVKVISFATQVVNGIKFRFKVEVNGEEETVSALRANDGEVKLLKSAP